MAFPLWRVDIIVHLGAEASQRLALRLPEGQLREAGEGILADGSREFFCAPRVAGELWCWLRSGKQFAIYGVTLEPIYDLDSPAAVEWIVSTVDCTALESEPVDEEILP